MREIMDAIQNWIKKKTLKVFTVVVYNLTYSILSVTSMLKGTFVLSFGVRAPLVDLPTGGGSLSITRNSPKITITARFTRLVGGYCVGLIHVRSQTYISGTGVLIFGDRT